MSAGESAVLRSAKPHVGKENSMLPPLTSPSHVLSLSRGQRFASPKAGHIRRPNSEDDSKVHVATSPIQSTSPDKMTPNQQRRIQQLEKSILFMKEHHEKILSALHEEIEELKRKNKELNYRLVMSPASLPAHLLSPEEDQPPAASSPRHQPARAAGLAAAASPVQLELLQGELGQLRDALRQERERGERLADNLKQAETQRNVSPSPAPPSAAVTELEQRLQAAENTIHQLRRERDDCQREMQRMRGSVQFRPPWRAGGQRAPPPPPPPQASRSSTRTGAAQQQQQQQLPRLPATSSGSNIRQETRRSAPARPADSRTSSQGSLPALPRGRARQNQPPPPPPPRHAKQQ